MWWILIVLTLLGLIILLMVLRSQHDRAWSIEMEQIKAHQHQATSYQSSATVRNTSHSVRLSPVQQFRLHQLWSIRRHLHKKVMGLNSIRLWHHFHQMV